MSYKIIADSCCEFPEEYKEGGLIKGLIVPQVFTCHIKS